MRLRSKEIVLVKLMWWEVLVKLSGLESGRVLERHITKFVENFKEIIIVNHIIKTGSKQIHELHEFTSLNASYIVKDNIDKIIFLNYTCIIRIKLSKLRVQVNFHVMIHFIYFLQNSSSF